FGVSTGLLAFGLWLVRLPLAEFFIAAALADRGAEADFQVVNLDFDSATLSNVRFGAETSPDAVIARLEAHWDWQGVTPQLRALRILEPRVRLRLDPAGRISAGALDRITGPANARRPALPYIELEIVDGQALIEAPFGAVIADFYAAGALGSDFSALARVTETSRGGGAYALARGAGELTLVSRDETLAFHLSATAGALDWAGAHFEDATFTAMGRAPLDLSNFEGDARWRVGLLQAPGLEARSANGVISAAALTRANALQITDWQSQAHASAARLEFAGTALLNPRFDANGEGVGPHGLAQWTLSAERFAGAALISRRPNASGALTLGANSAVNGEASVTLAQAQLSAEARQRLRESLPDVAGAPIGPTFAAAKRALDAAANAFEATIPLSIQGDLSALRVRLAAPVDARAVSGAHLRLSPLREDAPALVWRWPGAALHGALALELSGGGAPHVSLLLDTLDWRPEAPLEGDGTLTLADWRADGAGIAADELDVSFTLAPRGGGRIDLRGPVEISGPLGEGDVRGLVAALDLGVIWDAGWRVVPNQGCLSVRLGGVDAAGLSFSNGAFALCPHNGALIASDALGNLSGGFSIQRLALNGRMAGPDAQPARLGATNVIGRFSGRRGDVNLAIEAGAPTLRIEMAEARALAIAMHRLTARAQIDETWRVEGAFERGTLADPSLPGMVSTIAGVWTAAPEDGKPVIRVAAGEALLTANRPESTEDRALFNPLRLVEVGAVLRNGRIDASGAVVLAERARQLARFTAFHETADGVGGAQIVAQDLMFDETLQPFEITEQARGMVDNVRGHASVTADIAWTRAAITGTARARLDGLSLATSTIPVVENVRGEVFFDDVFAPTTAPGQNITVGLVNPGIAVRDGRVRFQLLPEQRVSIEQAEFDFAGGVLAMSPTVIALGAEETRFELALRDVDAARLVADLNLPDLAASGRVEGTFPLRLTRRSGFIENGVLRAQPGGGAIAYTGNAGASATGPARLAFDALRSFRYDNLSLTLNGDLSGEVVSQIAFSGENTGQAMDLGPVAPIPGLGRVTVRGVPFDFNVTVTAPFRRLAQTAASFTDPGALLDQAEQAGEERAVDPPPPAPR
ncbi:MAG: YdbH domain-containing protein, partial [Terricaulis sp.]